MTCTAPVTRLWAPNGVRVDSAYLTDVRPAGDRARDAWLDPPDRDGEWLTLTAHSGVTLAYVYAGGDPAAVRADLAATAGRLGGGFWFDLDTLTGTRPEPNAAALCRAHHARTAP